MAYFRGHFQSDIAGGENVPGIEESLAAIRVQKAGRPGWWRISHDSPAIVRKLRADRCELTVPLSAPESRLWMAYIRSHLQSDIGATKMRRNRGILIRD